MVKGCGEEPSVSLSSPLLWGGFSGNYKEEEEQRIMSTEVIKCGREMDDEWDA